LTILVVSATLSPIRSLSERTHMGRVAVVYFSGTGNTWTIARQYVHALRTRGQEADLYPIEKLSSAARDALASYDLIGIGYPVHVWNAPRRVAQFLHDLPRSQGQRIFLFATAGATLGGAFDWARDTLAERGYALIHEARYYVGSASHAHLQRGRLSMDEIARRFAWADTEVHEAVAEILSGGERHIYAPGWVRFLGSLLAWRLYLLLCRQGHRYFYADEKCDQCDLCVTACPTANIRLVDKKVLFGDRCTLCLRCLNICPRQAIQVAALTQGLERYLAPGYGWALLSGEGTLELHNLESAPALTGVPQESQDDLREDHDHSDA
jgi:ferredoxin